MSFWLKKPYPHQEQALDMYRQIGNLGLTFEMGCGKTGTAINIVRHQCAIYKRLLRVLIVTPQVTCTNWKNEFAIWSKIAFNNIFVATGTSANKASVIREAIDRRDSGAIIITNYETLINEHIFDLLDGFNPDFMILDEAHLCKNFKSRRTKACLKLGRNVPHKLILTGTPILNSIADIFYPILFLDGGKTFGRNFDVFKHTYMRDNNANWATKSSYFPDWQPREEMFAELNSRINTICFRVRTVDVLKDLPPYVVSFRHIEMSAEQKRYYKEMSRDFITFIKSSEGVPQAVVAQTAMTKALRFMQICSGHMITESGEVVRLKENPKLPIVEDLLEELVIGGKSKVILWASFKADVEALVYVCNKKKIKFSKITGDMSADEKQTDIDSFCKGDSMVMIANRRAGGIGINLVEAQYSVVFSRNFSLADELQSIARNYRSGSEHHSKIIRIELVIQDSIEEEVVKALQDKKNISDSIIDFVKRHL